MSVESVTCPRCEGKGFTRSCLDGLEVLPVGAWVAPPPCSLCKGRRRVSWTNPDAGYWMPVIVVKEPA